MAYYAYPHNMGRQSCPLTPAFAGDIEGEGVTDFFSEALFQPPGFQA
jgi:hypothetical protein